MDFSEYDITNIVHPGENIMYGSVPYLCYCYIASANFRIETNTDCLDNDGDGHYAINEVCPEGDDCNDDPYNGGGSIHPGANEICDNIDNDCDGETDEGCGIIMKKVSGDGQKGDVCKTLTKPFAVSAENTDGSPLQSDAGVGWTITNSPSGSNPRWAGEMIVPGDTNVIYKKYFGLGSIPGEYKAEASCSECTEGSPQNFTATAECPDVPVLRQGDPRWKDELYDNWCYINGNRSDRATCDRNADGTLKPGYTQFNIRSKGCALTSAAMVMNGYGYGHGKIDPVSLNQFMNDIGGYDEGNFTFDKLKNLTDPQLMVYKRSLNTGETSVPKSELDGWLEMCMPVIVGVNHNHHWVVVTKKVGNDYAIDDPGRPKTLLSQYGNIYAYRALYNVEGVCAQ